MIADVIFQWRERIRASILTSEEMKSKSCVILYIGVSLAKAVPLRAGSSLPPLSFQETSAEQRKCPFYAVYNVFARRSRADYHSPMASIRFNWTILLTFPYNHIRCGGVSASAQKPLSGQFGRRDLYINNSARVTVRVGFVLIIYIFLDYCLSLYGGVQFKNVPMALCLAQGIIMDALMPMYVLRY